MALAPGVILTTSLRGDYIFAHLINLGGGCLDEPSKHPTTHIVVVIPACALLLLMSVGLVSLEGGRG